MPTGLSISVTGEDTVSRSIRALRKLLPEALAIANQHTADEMVLEAQRQLRENDAIVTGDLYNSIQAQPSADGLRVAVGSTSEYAPYVEFGTRPHFPPPDAIRQWCRMRGLPDSAVWPICLKIAERGTSEQPFLYPAYLIGQRRHLDRVKAILAAVLRGAL